MLRVDGASCEVRGGYPLWVPWFGWACARALVTDDGGSRPGRPGRLEPRSYPLYRYLSFLLWHTLCKGVRSLFSLSETNAVRRPHGPPRRSLSVAQPTHHTTARRHVPKAHKASGDRNGHTRPLKSKPARERRTNVRALAVPPFPPPVCASLSEHDLSPSTPGGALKQQPPRSPKSARNESKRRGSRRARALSHPRSHPKRVAVHRARPRRRARSRRERLVLRAVRSSSPPNGGETGTSRRRCSCPSQSPCTNCGLGR